MTNQKKPKTGDVVGWAVYDTEVKFVIGNHQSREEARTDAKELNAMDNSRTFRLAKIVLAK